MGIGIMTWSDLLEELQELCCPVCGGDGQCDDAELGDISFRKWKCKACKGTGFKEGKIYRLSKYETVK